jgi:hypothetical protein
MVGRIRSHLVSLATVAALCACAVHEPYRARNEQVFGAIQLGMAQKDVERLVGRPDETLPLPHGGISWDYRYWDGWGYYALYSVGFDAQGVVASKLSARTHDGGGLN